VADHDHDVEHVQRVERGELVVQEREVADLTQALGTVKGVSEAKAFAGSENQGLHRRFLSVTSRSPGRARIVQ
jgi:hypothetical protein